MIAMEIPDIVVYSSLITNSNFYVYHSSFYDNNLHFMLFICSSCIDESQD